MNGFWWIFEALRVAQGPVADLGDGEGGGRRPGSEVGPFGPFRVSDSDVML